MKWYKKFAEVYGIESCKVEDRIFEQIRKNINALQSDIPMATVSIIGYNEEKHLTACLWSLSESKCCYPLEFIGIDNNSTDKTAEIFKRCGVKYFSESKAGCGHARQCGLTHAKGRFHINIDADTVYPPNYIQNMIEELLKPGVIAVSSTWGYFPDKRHSAVSLYWYTLSRDAYLWLQSHKRPELSVRGLVFGYSTKEAQQIGIRTDILRGEDGSLALELKKYGKIKFI